MPRIDEHYDASVRLALQLAKEQVAAVYGRNPSDVTEAEAHAHQDALWERRSAGSKVKTPTIPQLQAPKRKRSLSVSSEGAEAPSLRSVASDCPERRMHWAMQYLEHISQDGSFASSAYSFFAARVMQANVRVWLAPDDSVKRRRATPGDRYVAPNAKRTIDVAHTNEHFFAFGDDAPDADARMRSQVYQIRLPKETTADGNCFFHALAQQDNYENYNQVDAEAQWRIADKLRGDCVALAFDLVSRPHTREEAVEHLFRCATDEFGAASA